MIRRRSSRQGSARTVLSIDPQDPTPNNAIGHPRPCITNDPANQSSSTTSRSVLPSVQPTSVQSVVSSHTQVPQYRLNPKVLKVTQLWEEYDREHLIPIVVPVTLDLTIFT